jgi:hypothetical protein
LLSPISFLDAGEFGNKAAGCYTLSADRKAFGVVINENDDLIV